MREIDISSERFELRALRDLSARLGSNRLLVQASSGNTSIKIDDLLWIKASGKWLIHADADDFLIPVRLARARRCLKESTAIPETETKSPACTGASIETAMHVVLPQKVVVHVHSVNTIAWAVREDGPKHLSERLRGFDWQWIPYTPSGPSLARSIEHVLSCFPKTNVLVLGNHGLVVCGSSCHSAERLLSEVEDCLAIEPRRPPEAHPALLMQTLSGPSWSLSECESVHALATDRISRRILSGGVLYPCQAIFLPGTVPSFAFSPLEELYGVGERTTGPRLIDDEGVLCSEPMTRAEQEMLIGLAGVVQRIDASAPCRYLTASEVSDLLHGGSENYRRVADTDYYSKSSLLRA